MQSKLFSKEENMSLLPPEDQGLQRVHTSVPTEIDNIIEEVNEAMTPNEVAKVECECCGMSEDCTPTYIIRIKEFFCGKWVCGFCSEAVKEQVKRTPALTMEEAMESHMALCKKFNRTTRLNPKLSLAGAMRDIARKISQRRISMGSCVPKISRTSSCGEVFDLKIKRSPIQ
ncbi:uncharacterized protein LOC113461609 [Phoenix dactylifera]|uniref:Uncharacterized protein LOC113461609 n=1 Tax=Phoenix dactylifera TaxID=42345 RepID=A0A8B8J1A2_PHODC|nr:uncharacterized protein LOC113461609 [Phoenix dactylifera]